MRISAEAGTPLATFGQPGVVGFLGGERGSGIEAPDFACIEIHLRLAASDADLAGFGLRHLVASREQHQHRGGGEVFADVTEVAVGIEWHIGGERVSRRRPERMLVIEIFARGCEPRHRPTPAAIRIDTS